MLEWKFSKTWLEKPVFVVAATASFSNWYRVVKSHMELWEREQQLNRTLQFCSLPHWFNIVFTERCWIIHSRDGRNHHSNNIWLHRNPECVVTAWYCTEHHCCSANKGAEKKSSYLPDLVWPHISQSNLAEIYLIYVCQKSKPDNENKTDGLVSSLLSQKLCSAFFYLWIKLSQNMNNCIRCMHILFSYCEGCLNLLMGGI